MSLLETAHTFSVISRIKKEITRLGLIINILSFFIFSGYYGYLIIDNLDNVLYLSIYSVLFITVTILFLTEILLRKKKKIVKKNNV